MRYKIFDIQTEKFVSDCSNIAIKSDGTIVVIEKGQEVHKPNYTAIFFPYNSEEYYIDDIGGIHECGCGCDPNKNACGECSHVTCVNCEVWKRKLLNKE